MLIPLTLKIIHRLRANADPAYGYNTVMLADSEKILLHYITMCAIMYT